MEFLPSQYQRTYKLRGARGIWLILPLALGIVLTLGLIRIDRCQAQKTEMDQLVNADEPTAAFSDTLYVGIDVPYWPYEYYSGTQIIGHDISLMNAIAAELGVPVEYITVSWDTIFDGLITQKYDAVISGLTVTPEREAIIDFSLAYQSLYSPSWDGDLGIAVRQGDTLLRRQINQALFNLRENGTLETIINQTNVDLSSAYSDTWAALPEWPEVPANAETTFVFTDMGESATILQIPSGAVTEAILITYNLLSTDNISSSFTTAARVFDLDVYRGGTFLSDGYPFVLPIMITMHYSDTDVVGLNESELKLLYWDSVASNWIDAACGNYERNIEDNWLTLPICYLSRFALVEWDQSIKLLSVTPESAIIPAAGQVIQIEGQNFLDGMRVFLGSHPLSDVSRVSENLLEALVPITIPPGTYDLKVVSAQGDSHAVLLDAFTALEDAPPVVVAVEPKTGLNDIPVNIFIAGGNFSPGLNARLRNGTTEIPVEGLLFINSSMLRATVPVNTPPAIYELVLSNGSDDGLLSEAYTSLNPATSDDLFVIDASDLWSYPPSIQAGVPVTIGVTIRRQGGTGDLPDVTADFYLGPPATGTLIGTGIAALLHPNDTAEATITWAAPAAGHYTIYAVIDPNDEVFEDPDNNVISRTIRVVAPSLPATPPSVDRFVINDGAANSLKSQVVLNVSASSGALPAAMPSHLLYIEYEYIQSRYDWVPVAASPWLPYDLAHADFPWKLQPGPGVHYLQVWAADQNGLISLKPGETFINYLPSRAHAAMGQVYPYHYGLNPGAKLLARLTSFEPGDADLYAWDPEENFIEPSDDSQPVEVVTVTANLEGTYQLEVEGYGSSDFWLEINPVTSMANPSVNSRIVDMVASAIESPIIRGRGRPLTVTLPDENIGLPYAPGVPIFLPLLMR